jgi:hypothetical protein
MGGQCAVLHGASSRQMWQAQQSQFITALRLKMHKMGIQRTFGIK